MKTFKKIIFLVVLIFLYMFALSKGYYPETIAVKGEEVKISDIQVIPIGELVGIKEIRKHISAYIKNMPDATTMRNKINKIETKKELEDCLKEYFL